jgi:protoporphyrinogen oxidase
LCEIFFFPFNEKYTAGLLDKISLKDEYKTPIIKERIIESLERPSFGQEFGYNPKFFYPVNGLDALTAKMALRANISYEKEVVQIDTKRKEIIFRDGGGIKFEKLISTSPLKILMELSGMSEEIDFLLHNSLLVLNIGAIRGRKKIDLHWIYFTESKSRFHRIGFYSNVDKDFLPESLANDENIISLCREGISNGFRTAD